MSEWRGVAAKLTRGRAPSGVNASAPDGAAAGFLVFFPLCPPRAHQRFFSHSFRPHVVSRSWRRDHYSARLKHIDCFLQCQFRSAASEADLSAAQPSICPTRSFSFNRRLELGSVYRLGGLPRSRIDSSTKSLYFPVFVAALSTIRCRVAYRVEVLFTPCCHQACDNPWLPDNRPGNSHKEFAAKLCP